MKHFHVCFKNWLKTQNAVAVIEVVIEADGFEVTPAGALILYKDEGSAGRHVFMAINPGAWLPIEEVEENPVRIQ